MTLSELKALTQEELLEQFNDVSRNYIAEVKNVNALAQENMKLKIFARDAQNDIDFLNDEIVQLKKKIAIAQNALCELSKIK